MDSFIVPVIIGIILIVIGVQNTKGNIKTLHRYHRKRVTEEDRLPFGRKVGAGTIMTGCSVILLAFARIAADKLNRPFLETAGTVIAAAVMITGFAVITIAMFRYNKGLF